MNRAFHAVVLALTAVLAQSLAAQTTTESRPSCDSVLRAARGDTVRVTARAYLLRRDGDVLSTRALSLVLESILAHFKVPTPLELPVFSAGPARLRMLRAEMPGDSLTSREPTVYGVYRFTLRQGGTVTNVGITVPSIVRGFDESVTAAITAGARDSVPARITRALNADSLALELRITTGPEDIRLRVPPVSVFTTTFPRVRLVDAKPARANPLPPYPEEERDEGADGEVLLRVVVDGSGAPLIPTLEVLRATSPAFALAAARTLARYHFTPAHVGSCTVPQVVEVPFWFSLRP
jgi:hypothetical protein